MARNKSSEVPHYELLYIISNKYTEEETTPIIEKVSKVIEQNGGKITHREEWGKKRLAYSINHFSHGYYVLVEYDLSGGGQEKINKELKMATEILRHQTIAKEYKTEEEKKKEKKKKEEKIIKEKEEEEQVEEKKKEVEVAKPKKDIDMKDLDAKLDKILDTDDLL